MSSLQSAVHCPTYLQSVVHLFSIGESGAEMKEFYVDIMFVNNASGNATLLYDEFNMVRDRTVLLGDPYRMRSTLRTTVSPSYTIRSVKMYTREQYYLNGNPSYNVTPSIGAPGPMHIVYITDGRK